MAVESVSHRERRVMTLPDGFPIHFLVNPCAGGGRHRKRLPAVLAELRLRGVHYDVTETSAPGHATALVRALGDRERVFIAAGGDGTVNEVLNGMSHPDSVLGVLPAGTGNDFARLLGVRTPARAAEAIWRGRIERFDRIALRIVDAAGRSFEHAYVNTMGVGFDAVVGLRASQSTIGKGILPYLLAVFSTLRGYRAVPASITWEERGIQTELFLATLGNGTTSGGGFRLTPDALPDDGLLDMCLVGSVRIPRVLRILPRTLNGGHVREPEVTMARAPFCTIELASPLPVHTDGEIITREAVRIEAAVEPSSVNVLSMRDSA
jgi:diacylglycerol kinase (ATP)